MGLGLFFLCLDWCFGFYTVFLSDSELLVWCCFSTCLSFAVQVICFCPVSLGVYLAFMTSSVRAERWLVSSRADAAKISSTRCLRRWQINRLIHTLQTSTTTPNMGGKRTSEIMEIETREREKQFKRMKRNLFIEQREGLWCSLVPITFSVFRVVC